MGDVGLYNYWDTIQKHHSRWWPVGLFSFFSFFKLKKIFTPNIISQLEVVRSKANIRSGYKVFLPLHLIHCHQPNWISLNIISRILSAHLSTLFEPYSSNYHSTRQHIHYPLLPTSILITTNASFPQLHHGQSHFNLQAISIRWCCLYILRLLHRYYTQGHWTEEEVVLIRAKVQRKHGFEAEYKAHLEVRVCRGWIVQICSPLRGHGHLPGTALIPLPYTICYLNDDEYTD